jgi:hypothetical protein
VRTIIAAVVAAAMLVAAAGASAHAGNPSMRSTVQAVTPATEGVTVAVVNYDDRLELTNTSASTVVVGDYDGHPYARLLPDGTVQVNRNSPAFYLNDDRYGQTQVPKDLPAEPKWSVVDRTGRFQWHDHRMHWMSRSTPPQVTDKDKRTHIFDWKVPLTVDGRRGAISGSLTWVPLPGGSAPMGLIWSSAAVLVVLALVMLMIRRRRMDEVAPADAPSKVEAW